jgi:2-dehydro-3-deoxyphosphogluconate aldolase/(4S)-4-hydroxy-2-oxoglutarate aldolase
MASHTDLLAALDRSPAIGVMRGCPLENAVAVATAAARAGFRAVEVTMDSAEPGPSIRSIIAALPEVVVGAGTVRSPEEAEAAVAAGAAFLVTPVLALPVVAAAGSLGVPVIPGAATPTEIRTALDAGAAAAKVFPARELGGPAYLRAIAAPLGHPPVIPTGGIEAADGGAYLEAGALAVGFGGSVFPAHAMAAGDTDLIGSLAAAAVAGLLGATAPGDHPDDPPEQSDQGHGSHEHRP